MDLVCLAKQCPMSGLFIRETHGLAQEWGVTRGRPLFFQWIVDARINSALAHRNPVPKLEHVLGM
eukprot:scaffold718_cov342-Pavlova_lutheri.AAC.11